MTDKKNVVRVKIGSEEYTLRSDRSEEHTKAVAAHVDRALQEVRASGSVIEAHKIAVLAALAITDELFHSRARQAQTAERINGMVAEYSRLLPPEKRT